MQETWFDPWIGKIPWRREQLPTPVLLGFPDSSAGKESTCNAGDMGSIPGSGRCRLPTPVFLGFPDGSAGKESGCSAGDLDLIPGLGRSPGEGKGYLNSSILAWRIPWTVWSVELQGVGHN